VSAGTDTGHDRRREPGATFALDRQKVIDFASRSVHLTVEAAKQITTAYYSSPIQYSYFVGCSTGGRQALTAAQRFPDDFDGILVDAPILDLVGENLHTTWQARIMDSAAIEVEQLEVLTTAVYAKCDGADGLEDGVIENPPACGFDPAKDLPVCENATAGADCFTRDQIDALKKVYQGSPFFPGHVVGGEVFAERGNSRASGWEGTISPESVSWFAEPFLRYMAFEVPDPAYDWRSFDFEEDMSKVEWIRRIIDATDPDLRRFRDRGGKMLMTFGWADTALKPLRGVQYYEAVLDEMGPSTVDFFRLFMVPGRFHCGGGVGANRFESPGQDFGLPTGSLQAWVEEGVAPEQLLGLRVEQDSVLWTRPICAYPHVARYTGSGDSNDSANFECVEAGTP
jgi:feruloyl esterase